MSAREEQCQGAKASYLPLILDTAKKCAWYVNALGRGALADNSVVFVIGAGLAPVSRSVETEQRSVTL